MKAEVVVIADYDALVRGYAEPGERCEIQGLGQVPVALAKAMAEDCYLRSIVSKDGKQLVAVGKRHYIPDRLRRQVQARDRCCVVPGCDSDFRLEVDHIVEMARGGPTKLENLRLLCKTHHDLRTYRGFDIDGDGHWVQVRAAVANAWAKAG